MSLSWPDCFHMLALIWFPLCPSIDLILLSSKDCFHTWYWSDSLHVLASTWYFCPEWIVFTCWYWPDSLHVPVLIGLFSHPGTDLIPFMSLSWSDCFHILVLTWFPSCHCPDLIVFTPWYWPDSHHVLVEGFVEDILSIFRGAGCVSQQDITTFRQLSVFLQQSNVSADPLLSSMSFSILKKPQSWPAPSSSSSSSSPSPPSSRSLSPSSPPSSSSPSSPPSLSPPAPAPPQPPSSPSLSSSSSLHYVVIHQYM